MVDIKNNNVIMYQKIISDIKENIVNGLLKAEDRLPSEAKLVKQYKVSRVTTSKALNVLTEEGWIYRKQGNGTFVSKNINEIIQKSKNNHHTSEEDIGFEDENHDNNKKIESLGLILPSVLDNYAQELLDGITREVDKRGFSLLICLTLGNRDKEKESIRELISLGVKGILIFPIDFSIFNEEILEMKINHFPFVLLDRDLPGIITSYVMCDNYLGSKLAIQHLYNLGHRNIAFCSDNNLHVRSVADRYKGFKEQAKQYGIPHNIQFNAIDLDYTNFSKNYDLIDCIKNKNVSAFFIAESYACMYVSAMISSVGYKVPDDFSIVTFDNPMPAWEDMEFFTYIDQRSGEIGKEAVEILCNSILENNKEYFSKMIEPSLSIRKSTKKIESK